MQIRKKQELDGTDKEILRILYYKNRALVSSKIAKFVGLTSSAITPRLNNLLKKGILKKSKVYGVRKYKRAYANKTLKINAPQSIYWDIDLK